MSELFIREAKIFLSQTKYGSHGYPLAANQSWEIQEQDCPGVYSERKLNQGSISMGDNGEWITEKQLIFFSLRSALQQLCPTLASLVELEDPCE